MRTSLDGIDAACNMHTMSKRITFEFPPKAEERLNTLKVKTEAVSYAEVVKNALRLYEAMIEEVESGKQLFVHDKDGAAVPFNPFYTGGQ